MLQEISLVLLFLQGYYCNSKFAFESPQQSKEDSASIQYKPPKEFQQGRCS